MNLFPSFVVDKRKFYAKNSTHLFVLVPNNAGGITVNSNSIPILLIGLCLGITFGVALIPLFEIDCQTTFSTPHKQRNVVQKSLQHSEVSPQSNILRPRFYSTELGLRKKLLAGILLTDPSQLENLVAINRTLSSFVDQLLFFVVGQESAVKLRNLGFGEVVTLTSKRNDSTRGKLSGVQISQLGLRAIKYLGEKCSEDYDFFYLGIDQYYTNGVVLKETVNKVSVGADVFWGADGLNGVKCLLETGLLFSRSIIRKLSSKLDRCLTSKVLKQGTDPLKNCYAFSLGSQCSGTLGQTHKYLTTSSKDLTMFSLSVSIGPVKSAKEIYWIHLMISEKRDQEINQKITNISEEISKMQSEGYQANSWPFGISNPHRSQNRFDILNWKFFTQSNLYPQNDHIPQTDLSGGGIEALDISSVINNSVVYLTKIHGQNPTSLCFQYGYTRFDEVRGQEYILTFLNEVGTMLRVQSLRPISKVEIVPMPFVTEVRRVTIVIPISSLDLINATDAFIKNYLDSTDRKSNSVLIFAIILPNSANLQSVKLQNFKRMISKHNSDFNSGQGQGMDPNIKIGHVIVHLKQFKVSHPIFAVFDKLSNHILSPNSLVLAMNLFLGELKEEFLNRVRMNTILNWQVFSPIPFVEYDPKIYGRRENDKELEVSKSTGYFDEDSVNFISFCVGDYLTARKQSSNLSRLVHENGDDDGIGHLSQLFLSQFDSSVAATPHFLRAPEPTLIIRFDDNLYQNCSQNLKCLQKKWGSKAQLAKLIL